MSEITESIQQVSKRKVYGIPILFVVLVVIGVVLYARFGVKDAAPIEPVTEDYTGEDESGDVGGDAPAVFVATPTSAAATVAPDSNDAWGKRAVEWLIAQGASPAGASNAIARYLAGESLSQTEGGYRDKALKQFGLPPEGIIISQTLPYSGPAATQGTPPCSHKVRSKSDNTFLELSRLYYGRTDGDSVRFLSAANPTVTDPLPVGTVVKIPKLHEPRYYKATSANKSARAIARANSTTVTMIHNLNPGMKFPVKVGTRVRVV